ncbi:MAG TPA: alpha/beta hydrolase, partial [Polyangium sp.]|nr:alpha/beta hydrolase [Polyangium sp.]
MFIREYGSGPTVLALHGSPSAPTDFDPLVQQLQKTRRVLLPDMPGYGRSPHYPGLSLQRSVELIDEALISRGIKEVTIIGFSFGAWRGLLLALDGKTHVNALVALGGLAGFDPDHAVMALGYAKVLRGAESLRQPLLEEAMTARMISPDSARNNPAALAATMGWLDWPNPESLADEFEAGAVAMPCYDRLHTLRIPVLARVGELDVAAPPALSRRIVDAIPGAKLEIVEGKGHALLL